MRKRIARGVNVALWRPYSNRPFRDAFDCETGCGATKPAGARPTGWWKRFVNGRTERRCPACPPA